VNKTFEGIVLSVAAALIVSAIVGFYVNSNRHRLDGADSGEVVGRVDHAQNTVKRKATDSFAWDHLSDRQSVYFRDAIFVGRGSSLTLKLGEKQELELGENTLIVLDQSIGEGEKGGIVDVEVLRGEVAVRQDATAAHTPRLRFSLNKTKIDVSQKARVAVKKTEGSSSLLVQDGKVSVKDTSTKEEKTIHESGEKPTLIKDLSPQGRPKARRPSSLTFAETEVAARSENLIEALHKLTPDVLDDKNQTVLSQGQLKNIPLQKDDAYAESVKGTQEVRERPLSPVAQAPKTPRTRKPARALRPRPTPVEREEPLEQEVVKKPKQKPVKPPPLEKEMPVEKSLSLLTPADRSAIDQSKALEPIFFSWEVQGMVPAQYRLQVDSDAGFKHPLIELETADTSHIVDVATERRLAEIVLDKKKIFWRVLPLNEKGRPILQARKLPVARVDFEGTEKARLEVKKRVPYEKALFTDNVSSTLTLEWHATGALPYHYSVVLAEDSLFEKQICQKEYANRAVVDERLPAEAAREGEIKELPKVLDFSESLKIDPARDCNLTPYLSKGRTLYYRVTPLDKAGREIATVNPNSTVGRIVKEEFRITVAAGVSAFYLYYSADDSSQLNSSVQPSYSLKVSVFFKSMFEWLTNMEYAMLRYLFPGTPQVAATKNFFHVRSGLAYWYPLYSGDVQALRIGGRVSGDYFLHSLGQYDAIVRNNTRLVGMVLSLPIEYQFSESWVLSLAPGYYLGFNRGGKGYDVDLSLGYSFTSNFQFFAGARMSKTSLTVEDSGLTVHASYLNSALFGGISYTFD
jgi:hypothetical protein